MAAAGYLLDTDILSDLLVRPSGPVAAAIARAGEDGVCTSIVVACELRFGAGKRRSAVLTARIEALLGSIEVLPLAPGADRHYATIRARLEQHGTPIGPNDMLIAAHALALRRTLVTGKVREFRRVPNLDVENWLS